MTKNISRRTVSRSIAALAGIGVTQPVFGFGLTDVLGGGDNVAAADIGSLLDENKGLTGRFLSALVNLDAANAKLSEAFGIQLEADKNTSAAVLRSTGVIDQTSLKKAINYTQENRLIAQKEIDAGSALSERGKNVYSEAVLPYLFGTGEMILLVPEFTEFHAKITDVAADTQSLLSDPMGALELGKSVLTAGYIAIQTPKLAHDWIQYTYKLVSYGKTQNIDMSEAEAALDNMPTLTM